jgi:O-acetyl-ADP-ribose deacetylase (regulator of RNase III)
MDILCENIKLIEGNLLKMHFHGLDFIAHSCNVRNVMGAGIAKQIKELYPSAYEADSKANYENENQLGWYSFAWTDATQSKGIYNMYTQDLYKSYSWNGGRAVNYEAFYNALYNVADHIEWQDKHDDKTSTLGLPYGISCGLAGGSQRIINSMIHEILVDRSFKTYIVKYHE